MVILLYLVSFVRVKLLSILICCRLFNVLLVLSVLFILGVQNPNLKSKSFSYLYSLGFGSLTRESIITTWHAQGSSGLLRLVLLVNSPQLVLSFLYLNYNAFLTSLLLAQEWNGYARHRKTLRVTSATREQRSTFWLQLPYRYNIPLLLVSAALHWLVSQSIFLARVKYLDIGGVEIPEEEISTCGYSIIATISVLFLGFLVALVGIAIALRRYEIMMPVTDSCSAVISAACHPPESEVDAAFKPVKWGVINDNESWDANTKVRHCSFTSFDVSTPIEGQLYA